METLVTSAQQPCCIQIVAVQPLHLVGTILQHLELKSIDSGTVLNSQQTVPIVKELIKMKLNEIHMRSTCHSIRWVADRHNAIQLQNCRC